MSFCSPKSFGPILLLFWVLRLPVLADRWPQDLSQSLQTEPLKRVVLLQDALDEWDGSNPYWLVTLEDGTRAVFRSEDEPWGSEAEVAAYQLDQLLEVDLVPPTVHRVLQREEWPGDWPWEGDSRPGSLQFFVEGSTPAAQDRLSREDWARAEILGFLTGRYDNHSGNLLRDPQGRAVMIDFEGSLDLQQVRYGEFGFIRRGGWHHTPEVVSGDEAFPFDQAKELIDPSLEEVEETFGPWWGQIWPQGMKHLVRLLRGIPDRKVRYVLWDDLLWIQIKVRSRHACYTDHYPKGVMERVQALDKTTLQRVLVKPYRPIHHRLLMDRRRQLLKAYHESL